MIGTDFAPNKDTIFNSVIEIPISEIKVNERKRALYSDIWGLADSIRQLGLINPITVTQDYTLIAGNHRLNACKLLGWTTIQAVIVDQSAILTELAEIDENLIRFDLIALERGEHLKRRKEIYEILHPETKVGQTGGGKDGVGTVFKTDFTENGKSGVPSFAEDTAKKARVSKQTIYDYIQIADGLTERTKDILIGTDFEDSKTDLLKLSKEIPETQERIAEKLASGEAKGFQDARRIIASEEIQKTQPIEGKYRVIYADPPWDYGGSMNETYGTADKHYPTMPLEDICNLPVKEHSEENAVLFLWATSPQIPEALEVIKEWGFSYKASFVWDKIKHVMGHYNSVRHEFLLVATRGSATPEVMKLFDSVVSEERKEHSKKPETFRNIIETLYPSGNRIELFARVKTPGWEVWGNQA